MVLTSMADPIKTQLRYDEGKKEDAINLKKLGVNIKIISQATRLSIKEIEKL